jgi:hypothetical protein
MGALGCAAATRRTSTMASANRSAAAAKAWLYRFPLVPGDDQNEVVDGLVVGAMTRASIPEPEGRRLPPAASHAGNDRAPRGPPTLTAGVNPRAYVLEQHLQGQRVGR